MTLFAARGITKRFGGLVALKDVDFELESGIAAIIGPNGAGKTTLFNCFTGLYTPDAGVVTFEEHSLVGRNPDEITALGVCRTFQNIRLFKAMTALENVLVGMHARLRLGLWDVLVRGPRFRALEGEAWRRARTLSSTDMVRNSARFWKVRPMPISAIRCGGRSRIERPSNTISPETGV